MLKYFRFLSPTLFLILGFSVLMTSCRDPKELEYREFRNLKVSSLGFSAAQISIDLVFFNPNNFGLELNRTDLAIFIDGSYLGQSSQQLQIGIRKKDSFVLPLQIDVDMKNLLKNGLTALLNKTVTVRLTGKIRVSKAGVSKSFPVDYQTIQNFSSY